ncbi:MAG: hypothetical protein ACI9WT_001294, partial [Flavobacterium sp.]
AIQKLFFNMGITPNYPFRKIVFLLSGLTRERPLNVISISAKVL